MSGVCSIFLLSNTSTSPRLQNQHRVSVSHLPSDSQMCLTPLALRWVAGGRGASAPLPEHQQLPEIPGFGLFGWGVSACSPQGLVPRLCLSAPPGREE